VDDRLNLIEKNGAVSMEIVAKPRAKKSGIAGVRGGALEVRLAAPPVDGAANEELVRVLADAFSVSRRQIVIVRGDSSRMKLVRIEGMTAAALQAIVAEVIGSPSS